MKPLYLEIEGVKSVSDKQTIDFERVAKSGIFGVFGKTGSGKTTILDSIVLAIYGATTGSVDNKDFINVGRDSARVNLLFSVSGMGKTSKYRVERSYKLDKKRENAISSAKLFEVSDDGEICIAEGSSKVNKKLEEEIIGLEQKEFLRCIALPQGAFAEFLNLTRSQRLAFIGKLFGLEKYGKPLANKVNTKLRLLKEKENVELGKLSAYLEYDNQAVKSCAEEMQAVEEELNSLKQERDAKKIEFDAVKAKYDMGVLRAQKEKQYTEKLAYKSVIDDLIEKIQVYDSVLAVKNDIQRYQNAKQTLAQVEKKIKELDERGKEIATRQKRAKAERALIPELTEELDLLKGRMIMIRELSPKIELLDVKRKKLIALRDEYNKLGKELDRLKEDIVNDENLRQENIKLAKAQDVKGALKAVAEQASSKAFIEFAKETYDFLEELSELLKGEDLIAESAVNRLIDGEMQKIRFILTAESGVLEESLLTNCLAVLDKNAEYQNKAQEINAQIAAKKEKLNALEEKMKVCKAEGVAVREEHDILKTEIDAFLQGKSLLEVTRELNIKITALAERIVKINDEFERAERDVNQIALELNTQQVTAKEAERVISETQFVIEDILYQTKLDYEGILEVLKEGELRERDRVFVQSYKADCERLIAEIGELNEKLKDGAVEEEIYQKTLQTYTEVQKKVENLIEKYGKIKLNYEIVLKKNKEWCIINNNLKEISKEKAVLSKLYSLVENSKLMEFIAEVYLKEIAQDAERRVLVLTSGKYGLVYEGGTFFVIDNMRGGRKRPALGLSGGETFLISLSLALSLSFQISKKASRTLEFFFLDEGFGTLDDDLLDAVTTALEKLQRANLTVGLITHVSELKNRIGAKIEVTEATALHGTLINDNC